jgi:CubicO group peptidase (beta-lactamase class C family)
MTRPWLAAVLLLSGCLPLEPAGDAGPIDAAPTDAPRLGRDAGTPPEDLDGFVAWHMAEGGILGLAAATFQDGAIDQVHTFGMANETMPVDEHTLFLVASVTKTVVGALALQLAESGDLDLDADVSTYLGFTVRHPAFPGVPITARMLATHTSGLVDDWFALGAYTVEGDSDVPLATFTREYAADAAHWDDEAPGARRIYCNAGFGILGAVIEAAGGAPLPEQAETRVFGPLMLDGASLSLADTDLTRLASEQAWARAGGFASLPHRGYAHYPATSLRISVTGLSRWVLANARDGELDGVRFLSSELEAETRRAQFPSVSSGQRFAWYTVRLGAENWIGHTGSSHGSSAMVLFRESDRSGLVLLTNSDAYLRSRFGDDSGDVAIDAIATRLLAESGLP